MRGLVISAPSSGAGKTTLTLGLLAALRARGIAVQPFKCGPDYIDPAFHTVAAGRTSVNLDGWAMTPGHLASLVAAAKGCGDSIAIAEGAMGLFDGAANPGETGNGASADIAALMGWPVVLVVDVSGQAQTAAAVARGMANFRSGVAVAGVVLNKVASSRHEALCRAGFEEAGLLVLGCLPRAAGIQLPERHLGLVQAEETQELSVLLEEAGRIVEQHCDLDALIALADSEEPTISGTEKMAPPGMRIALARDKAFSFVYPHLMESWLSAGSTILPFSPLADEVPDPSADCCWLPGGYPELHAAQIAAAERFRTGLTIFADTKPVHGECGGYMVLGAGLVSADGVRHPMAGLLGLETSFAKKRMHLGYRLAQTLKPVFRNAESIRLRGHEFHYATILDHPDEPLATVVDANGSTVPETGSVRQMPGGGQVSGTYFHIIAQASS